MGTLNKAWHAANDTPEQIKMCLSCMRPECVDCLASSERKKERDKARSAQRYAAKSGAVYANGFRLNKAAQAMLRLYPTATGDKDIAEKINRDIVTVGNMRKKLGLPTIRSTTVEERTRLVAPFFVEGGVPSGSYS